MPTLRALGPVGEHQAAGEALQHVTRQCVNTLCENWDRKILMHHGRLSSEERNFVELLRVSQLAFSHVADLAGDAFSGRSATMMTSGGRIFQAMTRGEERLTEHLVGIEKGGASLATASYLAALLSHARRSLPGTLEDQLTHSASEAARHGPLARFATDFSTLCRSQHEPLACGPVDTVVHAVNQTILDRWEPVLVRYAAFGLAQLPRVSEQLTRLSELSAMAVEVVRSDGGSEDEAVATVWENVTDLLWSSAPLMRAYLDEWMARGNRIPDRHVLRLATTVPAREALPAGVEVVLERQTEQPGRMTALLSAAIAHANSSILLQKLADQAEPDAGQTKNANIAAVLVVAAHEARRLVPVWRDTDRQLRPETPTFPRSLFEAALDHAASSALDARNLLMLAHAQTRWLLEAVEYLEGRNRQDSLDALLDTVTRSAPMLTSRLLGAHVLRTGDVRSAREAYEERRTTPSPLDWTQLAACVWRACEADELSFAMSCIGDPLTTCCVDLIRSRLSTISGSAAKEIVHAYMQALIAAPTIDCHSVGLVAEAIETNDFITPADVDDRLLLAARPDRLPRERDLVIEFFARHPQRPRPLVPHRSTGVAVDYTGRTPRQLMAMVVLIGPDSVLADRERSALVRMACRTAHPWVTSMVALTLRNQPTLSLKEANWLADLARPPSVGLDFAALAASSLASRLHGPPQLDLDLAAGLVTAAIAAQAMGELLRQRSTGRVTMPERAANVFERRLRRLAGHAGDLARVRAYRSPPYIPKVITSSLYLDDTHPDSFDYVLVARRALIRAGV
ncbi:MAG: hypothetical protein KJ956_14485 [Actinobacteria bacterium]|nr:hypothetical protein [Actinomycetota bacterium]